jgi:hypothetical protein
MADRDGQPLSYRMLEMVEHRLFSQISLNWEGKPLRTLETMLK